MDGVEPPRAATDTSNPRAKWGDAMDAGFQIVPDVLFRHQKSLGLSALDVVILLNISLHWWEAEAKPFPRTSAIAARIGVSTRTVERRLSALEAMGLMKRLPSEKLSDGPLIRRIDLAGLSHRLQMLARQEPSFGFRRKAASATGNEKGRALAMPALPNEALSTEAVGPHDLVHQHPDRSLGDSGVQGPLHSAENPLCVKGQN